MSVTAAAEASTGKGETAAFDSNRFAAHYGVSQLPARRLQYLVKSGAGDSHLLRTLLLMQALDILQANGLHLLKGEDDVLERTARHSDRLEQPRRAWHPRNLPQLHRSRHLSLTPLIAVSDIC
jgi:hypothetical protein